MRLSLVVATLATQVLVATAAAAQDAPPPPPSPFVTPAPAGPSFDADRFVRIEVPAIGRHGALEMHEPNAARGGDEDDRWRTLCESPCSISVPVGTRLRINGDFRESQAFTAQNRGTMLLSVDPARSGVRAGHRRRGDRRDGHGAQRLRVRFDRSR